MYVDLPTWKIVKLPMMNDMDLATFWGTAGLRLVVYESDAKKNKKHYKVENKYVLCIETRHVDEPQSDEEEVEGGAMLRQNSRKDSVHSLPWGKVKKSMSRVDSISDLVAQMEESDSVTDDIKNPPQDNSFTDEEDDDDDADDDEGFFDAVEKMHTLSVSTSSLSADARSSVESEAEVRTSEKQQYCRYIKLTRQRDIFHCRTRTLQLPSHHLAWRPGRRPWWTSARTSSPSTSSPTSSV
jgi:hypothetical protein